LILIADHTTFFISSISALNSHPFPKTATFSMICCSNKWKPARSESGREAGRRWR
jgi:hypothetical protein